MNVQTADLARMIAEAAEEEKALDVIVMELKDLTVLADYFVIASGRSAIQVKSIAEGIEDRLLEKGFKAGRREGYSDGRWVILDYHGVMVHVFRQEDRNFYQLENLWADARRVQV